MEARNAQQHNRLSENYRTGDCEGKKITRPLAKNGSRRPKKWANMEKPPQKKLEGEKAQKSRQNEGTPLSQAATRLENDIGDCGGLFPLKIIHPLPSAPQFAPLVTWQPTYLIPYFRISAPTHASPLRFVHPSSTISEDENDESEKRKKLLTLSKIRQMAIIFKVDGKVKRGMFSF